MKDIIIIASILMMSFTAFAANNTVSNCGNVKIAVLDTGIESSHEQFYPGQVVSWKDFVNVSFNPDPPYDDHGHGTSTASLVGGKTLGTYPGAPLIIGKVLDSGGSGTWADVQDGIRWAISQNATIISLSLGSLIPFVGLYSDVDEAVEEAYRKNITVVVAAGNQYVEPSELVAIGYSPYAFVIGAAYKNGVPAEFSNLDPEVIAHGVNVNTAYLGNSYKVWNGTSFATPKIAGWAGLIYDKYCTNNITPDVVENAIKSTAKDSILPYTKEGHGFVNETTANLAIENALNPTLEPEITNSLYNKVSDVIRYAWTVG